MVVALIWLVYWQPRELFDDRSSLDLAAQLRDSELTPAAEAGSPSLHGNSRRKHEIRRVIGCESS
jgi:hypothetical protein